MDAAKPPPEPPFLLDAGAILQGLNLPATQCLTTPGVRAEIKRGGATGRRADFLDAAGLRVMAPTESSVARSEAAAQQAGTHKRLSPADIGIAALALDAGGTLVTDDYTLQDLARRLGIAWVTATTPGIMAPRSWRPRCAGCGRWFLQSPPHDVCAVCGSQVRPKPHGRGNAGPKSL